jgi:DNA-binding FadR family transcriptional regulator
MAGDAHPSGGAGRRRSGSIRQRRVAESVAAELRSRILAADVADGYRLPTQDRLVQEFGVSYPSIREAIRILETEGLVTVRRGNVGGAEVHRPDTASAAYHLGLALQGAQVTIGDLAVGLQTLEPLCAAACARRPDRMEAVVPALAASIETAASLIGSGAAFTHAARAFHDLVVAFTPNATVRYVVGSLVDLWTAQEELWAERSTSSGTYPSDVDAHDVLRAHQRILDEIAAGRPAEASRAAVAHLAATQVLFVDQYDEVAVNASFARPHRTSELTRPWRV